MEYFENLYAGTPEEFNRRDQGNSCVGASKMEIDNTLKIYKKKKKKKKKTGNLPVRTR